MKRCLNYEAGGRLMKKSVTYKHSNGYSAVLCGKTSMSVYYNGKEKFHTGFRNVNTEDEVMKLLEKMPLFLAELGMLV